MYKLAFIACVAVATLPAPAAAQDATPGAFAALHAGISSNRINLADDMIDRNDSAYALRGGYRWGNQFRYGAELGFVDLGHSTAEVTGGALDLHARGLTVGGNTEQRIGKWFVGAHGGWFHSRNKLTASVEDGGAALTGTYRSDGKDGWYAGATVGYQVSERIRFGLAYDNFSNRVSIAETGVRGRFNTELYSGFYELTF